MNTMWHCFVVVSSCAIQRLQSTCRTYKMTNDSYKKFNRLTRVNNNTREKSKEKTRNLSENSSPTKQFIQIHYNGQLTMKHGLLAYLIQHFFSLHQTPYYQPNDLTTDK